MLKKISLSLLLVLSISACGDQNAIIKERAKKCSFQILGYDKQGKNSNAIARLNHSEQLVQVPIKSGTIPKVRMGSILKGVCKETITKAGKRTNSFVVDIPVKQYAGDVYKFQS